MNGEEVRELAGAQWMLELGAPVTRHGTFEAYLHRLNSGQSLSYHEAYDYMAAVLAIEDERRRSAQLGVLLNGMMAKRLMLDEALGVVDAALDIDGHRPRARPAHPFSESVLGVAGSGKKGVKTPNISTPAAIIAAAAGVKVAKCASAATSSVAGSADTLKQLGVQLSGDAESTCEVMARCGVGFFEIEQMVPRFDDVYGGLFFAPHVLSLAFPALLLPMKTDKLFYGIAHPDVGLSLEVLRRYHDGDVLVASSTSDNVHWIDEIGVVGETMLVGVRMGERGSTTRVDVAKMLGIGPYEFPTMPPGGTPDDQARVVLEVLAGLAPPALRDFVGVNAATLIYLASTGTTMAEAFQIAGELVANGAALGKLEELARVSGGDASRIRRWL